jgi:hypothetical protein
LVKCHYPKCFIKRQSILHKSFKRSHWYLWRNYNRSQQTL